MIAGYLLEYTGRRNYYLLWLLEEEKRTIAVTNQALEEKIRELNQASEEIKTLSGFLPICSHCKKIRDDSGYWNQIETYISTHSEAKFSHGLCPECIKTLYPDIDLSISEEKKGGD